MGSITRLIRDPSYWRVVNELGTLEETGECVLDVVIGAIDDDHDGHYDRTVWMRENTFDNLKKGVYSLTNVRSYACMPFEVHDEAGNIVECVGCGRIY